MGEKEFVGNVIFELCFSRWRSAWRMHEEKLLTCLFLLSLCSMCSGRDVCA